jgi:CRISPR-associated endonuclease/helicase Cas3
MLTFTDFFRAVTGHAPFKWQTRLAKEVLKTNDGMNWPDVCQLPTASGKTAVVLIAAYAMGVRPDAHRRIAYVVDRRIVVDKTYDTLKKLQERVEDNDPKLRPWIDGLRETFGEEAKAGDATRSSILDVHLLRGGIGEPLVRLRSPLTPTIMVSTVDQLGSRLLFRGFGSPPRSWPIAAGLMSHDTLWILDEAHISTAFSQTLESIRRITERDPIGRPMKVVELTATPRPSSGRVFSLGEPCSAIRQRLTAKKPTKIVFVPDSAGVREAFPTFEGEVENAVEREFAAERKRIGIIVNRLRDARTIFDKLKRRYHERANVVLLIGPIRGVDREKLYKRDDVLALFSDQERPQTPTIAVCTQTVEVGADLDLDALVTQSAPIDVLEQRFGRLNRLGESKQETRGTIIHVDKPTKEGEPLPQDAIYGRAVFETAAMLKKIATNSPDGEFDMGISALPAMRADIVETMRSVAREGEPLVAPHIERLAQTWTTPYDDPDISAFLHGAPMDGDVSICWRRHLTGENVLDWEAHVNAALPTNKEVLSVAVGSAAAWLRQLITDEADIALSISSPVDKTSTDRPFYRIDSHDMSRKKRNPIGSVLRDPSLIRPGDIIVVPTEYGGCDEFGWSGSTKKGLEGLVLDVAEEAFKSERKARLAIDGLPDDAEESDIRELLKAIADNNQESDTRKAAALLLRKHFHWATQAVVGSTMWLSWRSRVMTDDGTPEDSSLLPRGTVSLVDHSEHVRDRARLMANACLRSQSIIEMLGVAGYLHDLGKAQIDFQRMLGNGIPDEKILAKGIRDRWSNGKRFRYLRENYRHEATSVAMLGDLSQFEDPALIRHLVGTHHGFGRPWFPILDDDRPEEVVAILDRPYRGPSDPALGRLESGWLQQFRDVNERYTAWGLAYIEAILRLADHRCSEEEDEGMPK